MKARGALCASVFLACAVVLRAGLPEGYPRGFHRLQVVGPCGYSYGVACFGDRIHYSDFNARSLFRLEANGDSVSVLDGVPGIYGLAAGDGALFYATDGDMNNAAIHRFIPGEPPTTPASGFTRPRQLFFEQRGTLLFALEGEGRIARLDPKTKLVSTVVENALVPQAAVSDGEDVFFTEYGQMAGDGTPVIQGRLSLAARNDQPNEEIIKVWRARGLARLGPGRFAVLSEADEYDHGSSASMQVVDSKGNVSLVVKGFDYPQFTAVDPEGNVLTTAPRDRLVLRFLTGSAAGGVEKLVQLGDGAAAFAAVHGSFADDPSGGAEEIHVSGGKSGTVVCRMHRDEQGRMAGWIRLAAEEFPDLSGREMKYPDVISRVFTPGVFPLPDIRVETKEGNVLRHHVLAQRRQEGCRWPMTNVGAEEEAPAAGFSEEPVAYLLYFEGGA